jgi:indolepyruvate ferredoxin oxidoreductase beta subunit
LINNQSIKPLTVISGDQVYPSDEQIRAAFASVTPNVEFVDGETIAKSLGNARVANVVLLGALSALLERNPVSSPELAADVWLRVITERVPPKHVDLNRQAFQAGREAVTR